MRQTEQEIKAAQLKALTKVLRQILGFRLHSQSYQLKDLLEALQKEGVKTDAFSILIVFDTHCTANITKYQNHKIRNPLVWFFYFDLEDQPSFTIDHFYQLFFQEKRILQSENTTNLSVNYERENTQNKIIQHRSNSIHSREGRKQLGMGYSESSKYGRIDR
jgi:hypothetical protein